MVLVGPHKDHGALRIGGTNSQRPVKPQHPHQLVDRASRAVGCAGPSTALDQLSAAADNQVPRTRRMLVSLFSELEQCTRTIHSRAAIRTPPIRAETQDWENSNFFVSPGAGQL